MTVGIYAIRHVESGKRYIGKSINIENRRYTHTHTLQKSPRGTDVNRHLWNAVQKHGWSAFVFEVVEEIAVIDEALIADRELHWMDHFRTTDRAFGYNLRRDSSTRMTVHPETRLRKSLEVMGENNPNFGNNWSDRQKALMSVDRQIRWVLGIGETPGLREKMSAASKLTWQDNDKRRAMAQKVSEAKTTHDFIQYTRDGKFVRTWSSIHEIIEANPGYKWQNIYAACNGSKPTYLNFIWKRVPKAAEAA